MKNVYYTDGNGKLPGMGESDHIYFVKCGSVDFLTTSSNIIKLLETPTLNLACLLKIVVSF